VAAFFLAPKIGSSEKNKKMRNEDNRFELQQLIQIGRICPRKTRILKGNIDVKQLQVPRQQELSTFE